MNGTASTSEAPTQHSGERRTFVALVALLVVLAGLLTWATAAGRSDPCAGLDLPKHEGTVLFRECIVLP